MRIKLEAAAANRMHDIIRAKDTVMNLQQRPDAEPPAAPQKPGMTANLLLILCFAISTAAGVWAAMAALDFFLPGPMTRPGALYSDSVAWLVRDFPEPRPVQNYWDISQDAGFAVSWVAHKLAETAARLATIMPSVAVFLVFAIGTTFLSFFMMWRLFLERIYDRKSPAP